MNNKQYLKLSALSLIAGCLFFALYNNWIIIHIPWKQYSNPTSQQVAYKKNSTLWYWFNNIWHQETKELVWSEQITDNLTNLVTSWLTLLNEESITDKKVSLQSVALSASDTEAYISFDRNPLDKQWNTATKLMVIEALLKTIRDAGIKIQTIRLLVHHQPLHDHHLDFSHSWPINGFLPENNSPVAVHQNSTLSPQKTITIMIDPSGDAKSTGRIIDGNFERGTTLQYAQELKKSLEEKLTNARIVLTRFPGESLEPLQNATFANRLNTDLYITISFYQETKNISQIFLYYFVYNPVTDFWKKKHDKLHFYTYAQAHLATIEQSYYYATRVENYLRDHKKPYFILKPKIGIPFAPLIGVQAPALGVEIGLLKKDDWRAYINPLAEAILSLIQ